MPPTTLNSEEPLKLLTAPTWFFVAAQFTP